MPASGPAVVALEGPAQLSSNGGGQRKTQRTEPAVPRASEDPATGSAGRSRSGDREGNHQRFFSLTVVTGRAATRDSFPRGDRHSSVSVRVHAGAPWNESGNANGAGAGRCGSSGGSDPTLAE